VTPARCPRRSARMVPHTDLLASPRIAPPDSPAVLAPLPGPATVV
jgi:hypothetical protein